MKKESGPRIGVHESWRHLISDPARRAWVEQWVQNSDAGRLFGIRMNEANLRHWKALLPALFAKGFDLKKVSGLFVHAKSRERKYKETRNTGPGLVEAALSAVADAEGKLADLARCCDGASAIVTDSDEPHRLLRDLRGFGGLISYVRSVESAQASLLRFKLRSRKLAPECRSLLAGPANRGRGRPPGGPLRAAAEVWQALGIPKAPTLGAHYAAIVIGTDVDRDSFARELRKLRAGSKRNEFIQARGTDSGPNDKTRGGELREEINAKIAALARKVARRTPSLLPQEWRTKFSK